MTHRLPISRMKRSYVGLLLASSAALAACTGDDPLSPNGSDAFGVVLTTAGPVSLASLGDTAALSSRVIDRNGQPLRNVPLKWSVSPAGIVEQDGAGIYRAIANGRVTIVAEIDPNETGVRPTGYWAGHVADTLVIEVRQRAARLTLAPVDTAFSMLGSWRQLRVQVTDARGHAMLDGPPALTWQSADARVATVDDAGVVRSIAEGTAQITVRADEIVGSATFAVRPRLPHTSCMVYAQRRQSRQSCVTLDLTLRERGTAR
jgi:hypothetical protein